MAIAALIFAPQSDGGSDSLARIMGQPLLAYQVRAAHRAGAQHLVVLAERVTPDVVATFDRLAADGLKVELVRDAAEAGDHLHPDELTLVIAPGMITEPRFLAHLVAHDRPQIIGLRDEPDLDALERIDGFTRWSGVALLPGALIRETSQTLGDWDLSSTLLRTALQTGVELEVIDLRHEGSPLIKLVQSDDDAAQVNHALLRHVEPQASGLVDHFLWSPLASLALPALMRADIGLGVVTALVGLFSMIALASAWLAPIFVPLLLFLVTGALVRLVSNLAQASLRDAARLRLLIAIRVVIGAIILGVIANRLVDYGIGWGYDVLTIWLLIEMARLGRRDPWFRGEGKLSRWSASPDAAAIAVLIGHMFDHDILALELMIAYYIASAGDIPLPRRS